MRIEYVDHVRCEQVDLLEIIVYIYHPAKMENIVESEVLFLADECGYRIRHIKAISRLLIAHFRHHKTPLHTFYFICSLS